MGGQDRTAGTAARLALPAFKGDKGDPGDGFLWQGDRTSAELEALRGALGDRPAELGVPQQRQQ
ncbi:MAG TPA: hypothetical protein H9751_06485 [Candidatus Corynebacterium faecigallinarum]|uniref:Uncharacterized protein n=1 Tax=Candidatus Corynebacterium faecigallinarum TaxID=2838528 RepID=A0A9D2QCP3_9CORY|nr:hypothetical protein [Candidatus Corynebacterium faecigallinarum]